MKIQSGSEADTLAFASKFADSLKAGDVVLFRGDLGAGKTFITRALCESLGCDDAATSPTFTLVQEYHGRRLPVYHVDLYRLEGGRDIESLGLEEYFDGDGVTVVEWAERLEEAGYPAPVGAWHIALRRLSDSGREILVGRK